MAVITTSGSGSLRASAMRATPRRAMSGKRRKMVQKLKHYLQVLSNQDTAENILAGSKGYIPYLFVGRFSSSEAKAIGILLSRCTAVLSARV